MRRSYEFPLHFQEGWSSLQTRLRSPDRKSTRLNSSHLGISYAVFCLKKKKTRDRVTARSINLHYGMTTQRVRTRVADRARWLAPLVLGPDIEVANCAAVSAASRQGMQ